MGYLEIAIGVCLGLFMFAGALVLLVVILAAIGEIADAIERRRK